MLDKEKVWKLSGSMLKDLLSLFGVVSTLGVFTAYYILTSYMAEIEFYPTAIETYVIFSIVIDFIEFYTILFFVIMAGSFFVYDQLTRDKFKEYDKSILFKSWWTSSIMIVIFFISYFGIYVVFDLSSKWASIIFFVLMTLLFSIEFLVLKKIENKEYIAITLYQILYSLLIFTILSMLYINTSIEWKNIFWIVVASVGIHSCPYVFILYYSKSWEKYKYLFFSIVIFSIVLFFISPNALTKVSIRDAMIGEIEYQQIKITDKECKYLNYYYDSKPCKKNILTDMKGLWLQGAVHYFEDKHGRYKIKSENIIYKVNSRN